MRGGAILCLVCDERIQNVKGLTARHIRLLLVQAKHSAEPVDQEIPSPDGSSHERDNSSASAAEDAPAVLEANHDKGGVELGREQNHLSSIFSVSRIKDIPSGYPNILLDDAAFATVINRYPTHLPPVCRVTPRKRVQSCGVLTVRCWLCCA